MYHKLNVIKGKVTADMAKLWQLVSIWANYVDSKRKVRILLSQAPSHCSSPQATGTDCVDTQPRMTDRDAEPQPQQTPPQLSDAPQQKAQPEAQQIRAEKHRLPLSSPSSHTPSLTTSLPTKKTTHHHHHNNNPPFGCVVLALCVWCFVRSTLSSCLPCLASAFAPLPAPKTQI